MTYHITYNDSLTKMAADRLSDFMTSIGYQIL